MTVISQVISLPLGAKLLQVSVHTSFKGHGTKLIQNNERRIKKFLTSQTVNQSHGLTKGPFSFKNFIKTLKKVKKAKGTRQYYITLTLDRVSLTISFRSDPTTLSLMCDIKYQVFNREKRL